MSFLDKLKSLVSKNTDKVDSAIDKVGDIVDQKTQGKYSSQVDKVQEAAKNAVEKNTAAQSGPVPPAQQSGQAPPPEPPPTS